MGDKTLISAETVQLFFTYFVRYFELPQVIICDRDPCLMAQFWILLLKLLSTKTLYFTANHPQSNEKTKYQHKTIQQILYALFLDIQHSIWFTIMLYIDMAINTTINVRTGRMPFMLVYRVETKMPIDLDISTSSDIISQFFAYKVSLLNKRMK